MTEELKTWFKQNQVLVITLIGQALVAAAYFVNLEARVSTLEERGSPHLAEINTRLTVLEGQTKDNKEAIDRVVAVMTKTLHINPSP
jgi:Tfp pilus assembly protein PilO